MRSRVALLIAGSLLISGITVPAIAGEIKSEQVPGEGRVTLQVADVPLGEVLSILARSVPLEIRGPVPSDVRVTAQFSGVALEDALARMLRGYNYVLLRPEGSTRPLLIVMNKIERPVQREPGPFGPGGAAPLPVSSQATQNVPATVSQQGGSGQVQMPVPVPQPVSGSGPQQGDTAGGNQGGMPGMPMPPRDAPQGAGPGGMLPSHTAPATGANPPPVPFPPPTAAGPNPQLPGGSVPMPSVPSQAQSPFQGPPEPARVMTPFGERPAE